MKIIDFIQHPKAAMRAAYEEKVRSSRQAEARRDIRISDNDGELYIMMKGEPVVPLSFISLEKRGALGVLLDELRQGLAEHRIDQTLKP